MSGADKKIAFICCTHNPIQFSECRKYLERLHVPESYSAEVLPIIGARSICAGYNEGMQATDARYKIYLHHDAFIVNPYFLDNLLLLFSEHPEAGMVGMVGSERLPGNAVMWTGKRIGSSSFLGETELPQEQIRPGHPVSRVTCLDGFLMATCVDLPWREDLLDGWDFYDISQSFEFRRKGYQIVVPVQSGAWCVHDDGLIMALFHYDHYREIFLREYGDEIDSYATVPIEGDAKERQAAEENYIRELRKFTKDADCIKDETGRLQQELDRCLRESDVGAFLQLAEGFSVEPAHTAMVWSSDLFYLSQIARSVRLEQQHQIPLFIDGVKTEAAFREKFMRCIFCFRNLEYDTPETENSLQYLRKQKVSAYSVATILYSENSLVGHRQKVLLVIAENAISAGEYMRAYLHLAVIRNATAEIEELKNELWQVIQPSDQGE